MLSMFLAVADPFRLLIVLALVGLLTWALVTFVPMPDPLPKVIVAVAVLVCILYALQSFGLF